MHQHQHQAYQQVDKEHSRMHQMTSEHGHQRQPRNVDNKYFLNLKIYLWCRGQFGSVGLGQFLADKWWEIWCFGANIRSSGWATGFSCGKCGTTNGQYLDWVRRLNGGDGITGIDRTLKSVRRDNGGDIRDNVNVKLCSNTWKNILAVWGSWTDFKNKLLLFIRFYFLWEIDKKKKKN